MEKATTEQVIDYLLEEIAEQEAYNNNFLKAKEKAIEEAMVDESPSYLWWRYIHEKYLKAPRLDIISDNRKMIQRLMIKQRSE